MGITILEAFPDEEFCRISIPICIESTREGRVMSDEFNKWWRRKFTGPEIGHKLDWVKRIALDAWIMAEKRQEEIDRLREENERLENV